VRANQLLSVSILNLFLIVEKLEDVRKQSEEEDQLFSQKSAG
jgi:hypothetical protein